MDDWAAEELDRIGDAEEVLIAPRRPDGSLRRPTIIWIVRHADRLFIRSVNGPDAVWFRAVRRTGEGRLSAKAFERDVRLLDAGDELDDEIDAAYEAKYPTSAASVRAMQTRSSRATTMEVAPLGAGRD